MEFSESKLPSFVLIVIVAVLISIGSVFLFMANFSEINGSKVDYIVFIIYLSVYVSMWLVYFASKDGPKIFRVPTLRRLLTLESKDWTNIDTSDNDEIEKLSMEKAKTSITAMAMLVGVSFLGIVQSKHIASSLDLSGDQGTYAWGVFISTGLASLSSIALVCFILSVDALDSMFNEFKDEQIENKFRRYFYKSTIYPKYIGLVCLLSSIIFFNASTNLVLGTMTVGLIMTVGYRHWFPDPTLASNDWQDRPKIWGFWLRLVPLVGIPIAASYFLPNIILLF